MPETKIYNLRIVPPIDVFNEVAHFKAQFRGIFGKQPLSKSKPHITLAMFKMNVRHQTEMLEVFGPLKRIETFALDIQGFGLFEGANVLLLEISKSEDISRIHTQIELLYRNHLSEKLDDFKISKTPHMTISKTDGRKMLYDSLAFFQHIAYVKRIQVGKLTWVSRDPGKTWDWEHHIQLSSGTQQTLF